MSREALERAAVDLAWSLWTELGVPGVLRRHRAMAIDPEPLIVVSPYISTLDPRLRDQMLLWCEAQSDRISASRLQGLSRASAEPVRRAFWSFTKTLRRRGRVRWPTDEAASCWVAEPAGEAPLLQLERPALLRLRLRALCGVGARSDILCELLALGDEAWMDAACLADEGYTKRNVARILSELADAGIVARRSERNRLLFRLVRSDHLRALAGAENLTFPRWRLLFGLVLGLLELSQRSESSSSVRRVEAHKLREKLAPMSELLRLPGPPVTRGDPAAWDLMLAWGAERVIEFSEGKVPDTTLG